MDLKTRQEIGQRIEQRFINWIMQYTPAKELKICDVETMAMMVRSITFDEIDKGSSDVDAEAIKRDLQKALAHGRFGIANPYGSMWSVNTFDTREEAAAYMREFEKRNQAVRLDKHKIIPVHVTVTPMISVEPLQKQAASNNP